jgi:ribosomal-protein-alanine N-acetyltransferase
LKNYTHEDPHDNDSESGEIQVLTPQDLSEIAEVLSEAYAEYKFPIGGSWTKELLRHEMKASQGVGLHVDGLGIVSFILFRHFDEHREITILATRPSRQRRGDMRYLLTYLLERKSPGERIWLEVHEGNLPARELYAQVGFQEVGRRPKYYRDGQDAILYTLGPVKE